MRAQTPAEQLPQHEEAQTQQKRRLSGASQEQQALGFWAYDTQLWASGAVQLVERCQFFGNATYLEVARLLEQQHGEISRVRLSSQAHKTRQRAERPWTK